MNARQREEEGRRVKVGVNVGAVIYVRDRTDRACIPWFEEVEWRGAREPVRHLRTLAALLENKLCSQRPSMPPVPGIQCPLQASTGTSHTCGTQTGKTLRHIK